MVADLAIRGVWQPQCEGIFDIRVVDTDGLSYRARLMNIRDEQEAQVLSPRLASIEEQVLPRFVCQLMGYLERKQTFSLIVCVNFYVLNGNDPLDQ